MALPMFLAMTAAEMSGMDSKSKHIAWLSCHFSPYTQGITNLPDSLPQGSMLILDDRFPCQGHSGSLTAGQLAETVKQLDCESLLLDFQRPGNPEIEAVIRQILNDVPCPVAVSEHYAAGLSCPVFLSPAPLHIPLETHLAPWEGREIWLEAALCQEQIIVTETGVQFNPQFPAEPMDGGFFNEVLCCQHKTEVSENEIRFHLFDTRESLEAKLKKAHSLGVTRAVGLYQELS